MLLVKDKAEQRLASALYQIRDEKRPDYRCIYLPIADQAELQAQLSSLCMSIARHIEDPEGQIMICEDNDIFVLAKGMTQKHAQTINDIVTPLTSAPAPGKGLVHFFDLQTQWVEAIESVESKIEFKKKKEADERQRQDAQFKKQQREGILSLPLDADLVRSINERRNARLTPEILIVEDDAFSRKLIVNSLRGEYAISSAEDGQAAIMLYALKAPDIVFLDIDLPDITGHDVLSKIIFLDPKAYVIMLSGNGNRDNIMKAIGAGAKGFIGKPFTKDKLVTYIQRCPTLKNK